MTLRVKNYHDCQKPDMKTGEVESWTVRGGLLMRREVRTRDLYEKREARWECPACKSTWRWSPDYNGYEGMWFAVNRTSHWTEVER